MPLVFAKKISMSTNNLLLQPIKAKAVELEALNRGSQKITGSVGGDDGDAGAPLPKRTNVTLDTGVLREALAPLRAVFSRDYI